MERSVRCVLAAGYAFVIVAAFITPAMPRIFWTILMPIVPLAIVLGGFTRWRGTCPIATIAAVATRITPCRRRAPAWMRRAFLALPLALLASFLVVRLVATNGDGPALGTSLGVVALAAFVTNLIFPGRTWCNYVCPVGVVERIYTDAAPLRTADAMPCRPCTGCKKSCPDAGQDRAYRSELGSAQQRTVWFAFPGLVLGFYTYYALRWGSYEAFFDGRWTERRLDPELVLGEGLAVAPFVPAVVAASATLALFAAASGVAFTLLERTLRRFGNDDVVARHRTLAIASFVAFNTFYLFAGQPTLRLVPVLAEMVSFAVPVIATLVLVRRWRAEPTTRVVPARRKGPALPVVG